MNHENQTPIRQLTLYKHGVAFVQRQAATTGERIDLVFRAEEVNDALKSLLVLDRRGGRVLGMHYGTPADAEARLATSPIVLSPEHSLIDLLQSLRGWMVRLVGGTPTAREEFTGRLLGVELNDPDMPLRQGFVAVLDETSGAVRTLPLRSLQEVTPLETRTREDLDFFLLTSRGDAAHRAVSIRLSPGEHDLAISYLVPSPTWRVSYRVVAEASPSDSGTQSGTLLIQGWGLFDNLFEEDLHDVAVTLTAGQPISFVYDLAASRIPQRPVVQDTARVAAAPVEFEDAIGSTQVQAMSARAESFSAPKRAARMLREAAAPMSAPSMDEFARQAAAATGTELGELFQYEVVAPVTVQRGESALVPILNARLPYTRELLFNEAKMPGHPVAALRFKNESGLVFERGPVTIVEDGTYRGEAIIQFTRAGSEIYLAFAVELGIKITLTHSTTSETAGIRIDGRLLHIRRATVQRVAYRLENNLPAEQVVTMEHPIWPTAELVDTDSPVARTASVYRWNVLCPARQVTTFGVAERRYDWEVSEVLDLSYARLQEFLQARWLDQKTEERIKALLDHQSAIARNEVEIAGLQAESETIYRREEQLRANMAALGAAGDEGALRRQIVAQLQASEDRIAVVEARIAALQKENIGHEAAIEAELAGLSVEGSGQTTEG